MGVAKEILKMAAAFAAGMFLYDTAKGAIAKFRG